MDNHKEKPSWEDDPNIPEGPLRRPNSSIVVNNLNSSVEESMHSLSLTDSSNTSNASVQSSTLSAEAKEWYPASYKKPSAQDRLLKIKPNLQQHQSNSESNGICLNEFSANQEVSVKLQEFITVLIEDPGQFDNLLKEFVDALAPYYNDVNVLHDIAKLIFSEAVSEPNFRYSAARLCKILEEQYPLFRTGLHLFAETLIDDVSVDGERDLALTLAELFAQSNCDNLYGNFVAKSIEKIVAIGGLENVKCVCQVLKLTGAALDIHHRTKLNLIFNQLEQAKPTLPSLANLIDYVISLRASHWGQVDTNNYSGPPGDMYSYNQVDGPIFYGPDGQELSEEENQFLAENCFEFFSEDLMDSDPDELFDPDNEMDEEVHAAFREFTKGNQE